MGSRIISVQLFPHHICQNDISVLFVGIFFSVECLSLILALGYVGSHCYTNDHVEEHFGVRGKMIG